MVCRAMSYICVRSQELESDKVGVTRFLKEA